MISIAVWQTVKIGNSSSSQTMTTRSASSNNTTVTVTAPESPKVSKNKLCIVSCQCRHRPYNAKMQISVEPRAGCHQAMEKPAEAVADKKIEKIEEAGTDAAAATTTEGPTAAESKTEEVKVGNSFVLLRMRMSVRIELNACVSCMF